jgi:L-lactate dehydrogenase complex protein LldG
MTERSAREAILRAVRAARAAHTPPPDVGTIARSFPRPAGSLAARFAAAAQAAGARVVEVTADCFAPMITEVAPQAKRVLSTISGIPGTVDIPEDPRLLADLDLLLCEAVFGVAENGAVWLPASRVGSRAAPFLATSVAVLLDRDAIVADLHDAYARLQLGAESFGVLVAGPSKTADIEQSLVIGAHGPKQLTVLLVDGTHLPSPHR